MNGILRILIVVLLIMVIGVSAFLAGFGVNYYLVAQAPSSGANVPAKFPLMWEAWNLIEQQYYGDIPQAPVLVHGMIRGMLASLGDSHTILVEAQPAQLEQNSLQGDYGGIGAQVEAKNGFLVLLPFPTGPAASAGILPDDILVKINDQDVTTDMTTDDVEVKLRGDIGSTVKLTLHRVGDTKNFDVTLKRDKINIPSVQYHMIANSSIAYVRITLESNDTAKEFEDALNALKQNKPTGVILDLRNNPGGVFPDPVLSIAGEFLPSNTTVVYERNRDGQEKTYGSTGNGLAKDLKLAVLVNGGTASDAEVLAGALQDTGRGVLVGEKTFGKGSVQSLHTLSDNSVLHVTTALWFTPKHNAIDGTGLKPNLAIPLTPDDTKKGADPQLDRAIQYLQTGQ